jgi:hypothetical protein
MSPAVHEEEEALLRKQKQGSHPQVSPSLHSPIALDRASPPTHHDYLIGSGDNTLGGNSRPKGHWLALRSPVQYPLTDIYTVAA